MSDELKTEPTSPAIAKKPGAFSTPTGRIVAIIIGLATVGIIVGVVVVIVLPLVFGEPEQPQTTKPPATAAGSQTPTATVAPKSPAAEIPNSDLFTFRDIFTPLIKEASQTTAAPIDGSTTTSDSVTPMENGVLYLVNILGYGDGTSKGLFYYNGVRYELGPGEGIPGTPWEVLKISPSGVVTMLYGDVQVTLSVGQGIRK